MKKLLVLILVLGMASAANAVLIEIDGQSAPALDVLEAATITVVGEDTSNWLGYIIVEEGGAGLLSGAEVLTGAGDKASVEPYTEAGWGAGYMLTVASTQVPTNVVAGPLFNINYTGAIGDTAKISLYIDPEYVVPAASVDVTVVPEPMTVLLLGLGGLFLRRRQ